MDRKLNFNNVKTITYDAASLVVPGGWQDISTAPKDQTRFIGVDATGKIAISYYMWPDDKKAVDESEVYSDGYGACGHDRWEPTHWMPLPTPPSSLPTPEPPDSQS